MAEDIAEKRKGGWGRASFARGSGGDRVDRGGGEPVDLRHERAAAGRKAQECLLSSAQEIPDPRVQDKMQRDPIGCLFPENGVGRLPARPGPKLFWRCAR